MIDKTSSYKDHVSTITEDGKGRKWMYPKLIKGKLYMLRNIFAGALLTLLFAGPFIKVNGEQLILLNILERRFAFFGVIFSPQDFYLFVLGTLIFIVFIVLFTSLFGRVFCGWACPQTIFMEMVFRRIERWIEGDAKQQKKLDSGPMTTEKILKKASKHFLFLLISFLISNIFLSYIIGSDQLIQIITEPLAGHVTGFISICIFTFVFYIVFSKIRELVCTVVCPYGRLQGVLLDSNSMIVAYDYVRGEPRGKRKREAGADVKGDCVDCGLCVDVCPTGIDIRNGTQMECINCTLCIDACDMVMEKINRPKRLIGFFSDEHITNRKQFTVGRRIYSYAAIILILSAILSFLILRRTDIETTILRASGTLYQMRDDGTVSNLYNAEFYNRTSQSIKFQVVPHGPGTQIQYITKPEELKKGASMKITFFIIQDIKNIKSYKSDIKLQVLSAGKVLENIETTFIAPPN
ncbi:Type cbb3 cytochrome oxidase biogeneis protein CcoG, involved in Cu oxidation [Arcticibacter svalbardensis MN12-7]|uniref:Type cbb3 cytochrome oxidase biogeneis protein CcoG, involved in Cu oxidation n=1 Tax=Arcticibacter svalbardensis MN12-7 TaxID=1150600 RepID=R9GU19_9SPHI|nr:cytochrome c oxidase accessory protein CcoG [Arcticibacter svalbardensis]EOR95153.1 Type cbb3 cytochrome oxidase biogeneis protein CcoG, involved in Cu oxidation [Arcticibacter svalbardensis MN12-7]